MQQGSGDQNLNLGANQKDQLKLVSLAYLKRAHKRGESNTMGSDNAACVVRKNLV